MSNQPPRTAVWLFRKIMRSYHRDTVLADLIEDFEWMCEKYGEKAAGKWFWQQVFRSIPHFIHHLIYWSLLMFTNYVKIAFRNIKRHKGYSAINILGLAAGITCFIFILLYVRFELSYDTYHPGAEQIYRVCKSRKTEVKHDLFAANVNDVAPALLEKYPEVIAAGRSGTRGLKTLIIGNEKFNEPGIKLTDQGFLNLFEPEAVYGKIRHALTRPNTMVITASIAGKYFPGENPVGKTIRIDTIAYEITAVVADCPANTHYPYSILCYMDIENMEYNTPWDGWHCMNYIKLAKGTDAAAFEEKIRFLPHEYAAEKLEKKGVTFTLFLQPLTDIYLHSRLNWEAEPPGNITYVYIFALIGFLILLIAGINYMNLATARSANRAGEVGMRKVAGAQRSQLIQQFIGESTLISFLALLVGLFLVYLLLPAYNLLISARFEFGDLWQPQML